MNWMIDFIYALFVSTILGSIMYIVLRLCCATLNKFLVARITCIMLRVVLIGFFTFLILFFNSTTRGKYVDHYSLLYESEINPIFINQLTLLQIIFAAWLLGFLASISTFGYSYIQFHRRIILHNYPLKGIGSELVRHIDSIAGLNRSFMIYGNDQIAVPAVIGIIHPMILIPKTEIDDIDLKIILLHEMTHIKNHDLIFKYLVLILKSILWFNPLVYSFSRFFNRCMEYYCDETSCEKGRSIFTKKQYFKTILNMQAQNKRLFVLSSSLTEHGIKIEGRIMNMKKYKTPTRRMKLSAIALSIFMLITSTSTAYAATKTVNNMANKRYLTASNMIKLTTPLTVTTTERLSDEQPKDTILFATRIADTVPINIKAKAGKTYQTAVFKKNAGETVRISITWAPEGCEVKAGLFHATGETYAESTTSIDQTIDIDETGDYCVFIKNLSDETITITGFAYIR